jgi:hypothetical protein
VKADELLLWLSARKQGTWEQFKGAAEALHAPDDESAQEDGVGAEEERGRDALPLYQRLRLNLERLGHAEFFARDCEDGWRVAPPVIAVREHAGSCTGILCGARSRQLLAHLDAAAAGKAVLQTEEQDGAPLVYRVAAADRSALVSLAAEAGTHLQVDAPLAILCSLPSVSDRLLHRPQELPLGPDWRVESFSAETFGWSESGREEALRAREGVFRFRFRYEWRHFLCLRGTAYELPGQIAKYVLLRRRRKVLAYDEQALTLMLPAVCRPPPLLDRALVLCTGRLPSFNGQAKTLTYTGIPPIIAQVAARLLCQEN